MFIERSGKTPHFSAEELEKIYYSAQTRDTAGMQASARQLYPDRPDTAYESLYLSKGPGRSFKNEKGEYEPPKEILMSWPIGIGILKDGSVHEF